MITIYAANATDFSTLGLGALAPSACTIEEQAGGLYELTLTQPITDDLKHTLIAQGRIIKAPAPVRETPLVEIGKSGSVTRRIYKVTTDGRRLNMRTAADQSARVIHAYRPGTEVAVTGESGSWSSVIILDGGASGWMWTANLTFVREESETISGDAPGSVIAPRQTREQLFRICEVETDGESRAVTARAQHISYDLKGAIVAREYAPENVSAETVCAAMMGYIDHETPFRLICTVTESVTIDCTGRNILDILMDRDSGLLTQTGARLIRDNYDLFILPDEARDRGVSLRYGKNLLSAVLRTDASGLITRIQPAGKAKDGETLLISDDPAQSFVDSPRIGDYPAIYAKRVEYDVVEGRDLTKAEAREKLREKALSDFDAGCDLPSIRLDADFVRLDLTEDYKALANAYALHLYDSVPVTDDAAGIAARARMTGYKYDALLDRYDGTTLGELTDAQATVYGDEIGGGVSGTKIISGSMSGDRLRNLSVAYAKISRAAVDQLSADSLTAQIAHINALTAGTIDADQLTAAWAKLYTIIAGQIEAGTVTADTLTAAMAKLTKASVEHAEIDWANISKLTAAMADIATARIGDADIDFAQIKQMKAGTAVADQLITHDAVADRYFIDKLQVRALQVLEQTVGSLTVKARDGNYYRLDIDPEAGTVVPTLVTPSDDEKAEGVTGDQSRCIIETDLTVADLAASNVKAINALIDKLTASRIEVDTLFAREATVGALDAYLVRASTIEALEGQLDVWASEKITLAVKNVQIGGTNLLHHTGDMSAAGGVGFSCDSSGADAMGTAVRQDDGSMLVTNSASNLRFVHSRLDVAAGEVYTVSAEYKDVSGACPHQFQMVSGSESNDIIANAVSEGDKTTLADGWVRSVFTFEIPEGATYVTPFFRSGTDYTLYTHQYYIRRPQLERGNKATDWSPNPADVDGRLSAAESTIVQQADEIAARVTQTTYNAGMAGKANASDLNALSGRVSTAETSIVQNANSITSKASQSDVNALGERVTTAESEIRQTPDRISAAVSAVQVGGTNLLHGISVWGLIDGQGFTFDSSGAGAMGAYAAQSDGSLLVTNNGSNVRIIHGNIAVQPGEVYTVSAEYKDVSGECPHQFQMAFANSAGAFAGNAVSVGDKTALADGWVRSVLTFTIPEGVTQLTPFFRSGVDYAVYTHQYYIRRPKLERGNKATDWSPNPAEVRDIRIGSNILMDVYHTEISTPYLDIDVSGTEGDMHIDEHGISGGTGTFKTLNCPDVVKSTGSAIYSGGLQETFDALNGRFLTGDVTISLSADQYGTFVLKGVYGVNASINIVGNGHSVNGVLAVYNCKLVNINIGGLTINGNGSSTPLVLMDAGFVSVSGVTINGGGAGTAVDANYGTRLMMYDNGLYNASNLIRLGHCTEGSLIQLRGGTCTNYLRADGARWTMSGTRPDGTYAQENTCLHAPENPDSLTIDYGTSQPPVTPVTTASFTATATGTYYPSGHWVNDNTIRQGHEGTGSNGRKDYGCMWFGASTLSGKTVKSATLTIKRIAGKGRSSSVTMKLWTTTVTGKSGVMAASTMTSLGEIGKIGNGETVTVSVPVSAIGTIAAGGGLVLYTEETANASGKTYSANYAHFEGTDGSAPVLTVTYQ